MLTLATLRHKIRLSINPNEEDHVRLADLADQIMVEIGPMNYRDGSSVGALQNQMTATAQTILKREWERVKAGK